MLSTAKSANVRFASETLLRNTGVARVCGGAGRTRRHLLGGGKLAKIVKKIHVKFQTVSFICLRVQQKQSLRASAIVGFIGSLTASSSTCLVLRLGLPQVPGYPSGIRVKNYPGNFYRATQLC